MDTGFGSGGKVITAIGAGNDLAGSMVIQPDGKIIVTGNSHNGSNHDFATVRYNTDGSLDTGFGTGGKITEDFGIGNDYGTSVALLQDGKIVVSGTVYNGSNYDFGLVIYNNNPLPPFVMTESVSAVTGETASVVGTITGEGGGGTVTARGVCYGTAWEPVTPCTNEGTGTGSFTATLSGLTSSKTYYVRAYATNSAGTSYGSGISFKTGAIPIIAQTSPLSVTMDEDETPVAWSPPDLTRGRG